MNVSEKVRMFRAHLNLNQSEFWQLMGVAGGFSRYDKGHLKPNMEMLEIMAKHGLNLNWLVDDNAPMLKDDIREIRINEPAENYPGQNSCKQLIEITQTQIQSLKQSLEMIEIIAKSK